jgi:hypothetical protein
MKYITFQDGMVGNAIITNTLKIKTKLKHSEVWLAMQSLPTHLAEIKWTNSPVPLA